MPKLRALLLPVLLAGCQSGACVMPLATVIPMTLSKDGDTLTIPARVAGRDLTLIVDTGAEISLLSYAALPSHQQVLGDVDLQGIGGSNTGGATNLTHLELGRLHGGASAVLTDKVFTVDGQKVDGLIGMSVLGAYDIDLDVPDGQMRLYQPTGDCSAPAAVLPPPLFVVPEMGTDQQLKIRVHVTIDGQQFNALIDTGSDDTALFRSAARRLGLTPAVLAADPVGQSQGIGETTEVAHAHVLDEVGIGDLAIRNMQVSVVEEDPFADERVDLLIGMDFVRRAHLWISNSSHDLIMQFPPTGSPPLPAGM